MTSHIWENESSDRQEYIADKFREAFNLTGSDSLNNFKEKITDILTLEEVEAGFLDNLQFDMLNYFHGERKKGAMIEGIYHIAQEQIGETKIQERIKDEDTKFIKEPGEDYKILYEKEEIPGFVKGKKVFVNVERYIKDGKIHYRYRDVKTGHLATLSEK